MFENLTDQEREIFTAKMWHAGGQLDAEYLALSKTDRRTLASYGIGDTFGVLVSDWLMAAIDCYRLARDLEHTGPQS